MYKYETHLHTCEASACGFSSGADYPAYYKAMGYDGIFITDHFFNGNSCIPKYKSWEKRINAFCKGYEKAKEAGDKIGFPVFFGWEANFEGDEFLIYGLDKEWLLNHPDLLSYSRTKQYDVVHEAGGLVVQAHPFRERGYLNTIRLNPETCDAMEAYNAFNMTYCNHNAEIYCRELGIFTTAGSDLHKMDSIPARNHLGMEFDFPITCEMDYVHAILERKGKMCVPPEEKLDESMINQGINVKLPVIVNHRE